MLFKCQLDGSQSRGVHILVYIRLLVSKGRKLFCLPVPVFCKEKPIFHYENTPIQIHLEFYHQKNENFQIKKSDILNVFAQNIDCWYSLEPPRRGGSNEYPQSLI